MTTFASSVERSAIRRRVARGAAAIASVVVGLVLSGSVLTTASATTTSACPDKTGVTVVVDFGELGGGVQVACAAWPVSSGLDALESAGFDWTPVASQPAFVCRIDGKPATDACQVTPPADKYWNYWHADRGGGWIYSSHGAGSSQPAAGSVEGWAFGDSVQPGVPPPPPYEPPPTTPPPTSAPPTAPTTTAPVTQPPQPPSTTEPTGTTPPAPASTTPTATAAPTSAAVTTEPFATATDAATAGSSSAPTSATTSGSGSSPVGTIVGGAVVLVLATAGGVVAWRRRLRASE